MDTKAAFEKFRDWWFAEEQAELRLNFAEGWGFRVWLASRAAIEIELESLSDSYFASDIKNSFEHGRATERRKTIDVLTSHGIRIKGKTE